MAELIVIPVRPLQDILEEVVYREASMEVFFVAHSKVVCEGAGGASGHPKVYYTIMDSGYAECKYCDRLFVYDPSKAGTILEGGLVSR